MDSFSRYIFAESVVPSSKINEVYLCVYWLLLNHTNSKIHHRIVIHMAKNGWEPSVEELPIYSTGLPLACDVLQSRYVSALDSAVVHTHLAGQRQTSGHNPMV